MRKRLHLPPSLKGGAPYVAASLVLSALSELLPGKPGFNAITLISLAATALLIYGYYRWNRDEPRFTRVLWAFPLYGFLAALVLFPLAMGGAAGALATGPALAFLYLGFYGGAIAALVYYPLRLAGRVLGAPWLETAFFALASAGVFLFLPPLNLLVTLAEFAVGAVLGYAALFAPGEDKQAGTPG